MWGEPSPYHATVELSYLAFARFSWDPELTWERFLAEDVAPLLGGVDAAQQFVAIAEEVDANQVLPLERCSALRRAAMAPSCRRRRRPALALARGPDRRRIYMGE